MSFKEQNGGYTLTPEKSQSYSAKMFSDFSPVVANLYCYM